MDSSNIVELIYGELEGVTLSAADWVGVIKKNIAILQPLKYLPMKPLGKYFNCKVPHSADGQKRKAELDNIVFPEGINIKTQCQLLGCPLKLEDIGLIKEWELSLNTNRKNSWLLLTQKADWLLCNYISKIDYDNKKEIIYKGEILTLSDEDMVKIFKHELEIVINGQNSPIFLGKAIFASLADLIQRDVAIREKRLQKQKIKKQQLALIKNLVLPASKKIEILELS